MGAAPAGAAPGAAPAADLVAFARAFNAAWNAHDVEGVVAFFAPDATVRQTRARVAGARRHAGHRAGDRGRLRRGPAVARRRGAVDPGAWARGEVLWAAGTPRLRAWLPALFAAGHRVEASAYRTDGDVVTWRFRAFADPYQGVAGVEPVEGTASLVVRAGRAVALGFETEGETVDRRARQFDAALSARLTAAWAALRPPRRVPGARPAPAPAAAARTGPSRGCSWASGARRRWPACWRAGGGADEARAARRRSHLGPSRRERGKRFSAPQSGLSWER